jgi:hypothetical protein
VFITQTGDVRLMGLDGAFNRTSDDIAKDHLAFAWLVIDLLGDRSHSGQLRRPEGLTDKQWRAVEAVILVQGAQGDKLVQLFADPERAASVAAPVRVPVEEIRPLPYAAPPSSSSDLFGRGGGKAKWVWGLLVLGLASGVGYMAYERPDLTLPAAAAPLPAAVAAKDSSAPAAPAARVPDPPAAEIAPATAPVSRRSTIYLAQESLQVEDGVALARVRVLRQGNTTASATFVWWTENGSASPDIDFYAVTPRSAQFEADSSSVDLFVPLIPTTTHTEPVTFYVKIDEAGNGARLGERTLAQVSIVPPGYVPAPASEDAPD